MKTYIYSSLLFVIIISMNSCTKNSDYPIEENDPSGDYTYTSYSKYNVDSDDESISATSDGFMFVSWYNQNTSSNIDITVNPDFGYSYYLRASTIDTHGDTTTFRINSQVINVNGDDYKIVGNKGVYVPYLGEYDGYFIQDKKIVYSFKSTNIENYEITETYTEGVKY